MGVVEDSPAGQPADSRVGTVFGPYRLNRLLGSGGFGEVYEAEDTSMNRVVALKLLATTFSQNPVFRERLFREARTAGRLREPHVLPIHNCGEIDGQVYIDMRLVRGVDLETVLRREGTLDPVRAVNLVLQVASALDAAHAETVIHRDVKPANILLAGPGGQDFASLVDFGLANAAGEARLTKPGKAVGTFDYVAPERLNNSEVDHRCDVYALACVLYELLTGAPPYADSGDLSALMNAHLSAPIPRPSQHRAGIPAGFDDVIARGLAKNPDERYRTAGELADAAQHALGPAEPTRPWQTLPPPAQTAPPAQLQPAQVQPHPAQSWAPAPTTPSPQPPPAWAVDPARRRKRRVVIAVATLALVAVATAVVIWAVPWPGSHPAASGPARPAPTGTVFLPFPNLAQVRGVAVDSAGNVYAAELTNHAPDGRVLKLAPGETATAELPFGEVYAEGVAADGAGNVYVADREAMGVWKLARGGHGPALLPYGHLSMPVAVAVDKDGNVYVADQGLKQVLKLPPGAPAPAQLMPTTPLSAPIGIAVDDAGDVFIVDQGDNHILKLAAGATTPTELPFTGLDQPYGVAVDKNGTVYVTDPLIHKVFKLTTGAATSTELSIPALDYPYGVAVDGHGDLYVSDCHRSDQCETGRVLKLGAGS